MNASRASPAIRSEDRVGDPDVADASSKSQRKREMHALQALGQRLTELPATQLDRLALPVELIEAIVLARSITAREGRRRQLQYIGKLMRRVDADAIHAQLDLDGSQHRHETAVMHASEHWRDVLLETPERLSEFVARNPGAANRSLHPLLRSARAEHARGQRGRHCRELYRALRDALAAETPPRRDT